MVPFAYAAAASAPAAIRHVAQRRDAEFIAGGTDMLQLLQDGVRSPSELIDINRLPMTAIEVGPNGARLGALARMADVADDPRIRAEFPMVAEALLASASPQVRNMATIGGNLLQRTRCLYFRDVATPCNRREPGSGCPAQEGANWLNAILGGSPQCIAVYPGDLAVALIALDAEVLVQGAAALAPARGGGGSGRPAAGGRCSGRGRRALGRRRRAARTERVQGDAAAADRRARAAHGRRPRVNRSIGRPISRVDGPAKVTG